MANWIKHIVLLLLVLLMLIFINNPKDFGVFCGAVAILYAILWGEAAKK